MTTPSIPKTTLAETLRLYKLVRLWIGLFMFGLILSGITAIPLEWELNLLDSLLKTWPVWPALVEWISFIKAGLHETYAHYPFLAYGTDWLAFAHIVIAIAFIGPFRDPLKNIWVVEFGLLACLLVIPAALIFGPLRGIPIFWQMIDCSFGIIGFIPLWVCRQTIHKIEHLPNSYRFHIDEIRPEAI